jgi:hypothetical protein
MVKLDMTPALLGQRVTLGPAPWFRVERNELRQGPTESLVGQLRDHQWAVEGRTFAMVQATPNTLLQFAGASGDPEAPSGPYQEVHLADGAFYADGSLVARFDDDTYLWRCVRTQQSWPAVLVTSADEGD